MAHDAISKQVRIMPRRPTIKGPPAHPSRRPVTLRRSESYDGDLEYDENEGGAGGDPVLPTSELETSDTKSDSSAAAATETKLSPERAKNRQIVDKYCTNKQKLAKNGEGIDNKTPRFDVPPSIPKTPREAVDLLRAAAEAFKADPNAIHELVQGTKIVLREIEPFGRPSGVSPPQPAPALELPPATVLWKDHKGEWSSPYEFAIKHYKRYFSKGWTKASLLEPGQDKPLYDALTYWLRKNSASLPPAMKPIFLSKTKLNDETLYQLGISHAADVTPDLVPDLRERMRLNSLAHRRFG